MADTDVFYCEVRERTGKGGARAARREGWIPGVIYGGGADPAPIKLRRNEIRNAYLKGRLKSHLANIDVQGEDGLQPVIPRDVQLDPVKGEPVHVDLLRVDEKTRIDVAIPVRFINDETSPGVKRGGVISVVRHEIEVFAPATAIPAFFEADIGELDIGDVLHVSAISMPEGVSLVTTDRDFTIATMAAPSSVRSSENEDDEEGAAEGEEAAEETEGDSE
ncbi:MAG: 50S ribosomal protein L25/general stress protein Ctc [Pseudomonadota bacterium]